MRSIKYFFILFTALISLGGLLSAGSAVLNVSDTHISKGEELIIDIAANGSDIVFPEIDKIGDYVVDRVGMTDNIIIGSKSKHTRTVSYALYPESNITIPSFKVKIDGKIEQTKPVKIYVNTSRNTTAQKSGYSMTMTSSKKEVYEGEPFWLQVVFFMPKSSDVVQDNKYTPPNFDGFFVKSDQKFIPKRSSAGTSYVINYILTPQRSGDIVIPAPQMKIGIRTFKGARDPWGFFNNEISWRTFKGNPIKVKVKPTPPNVDLVGSFEIKATVDTKSIDANKPVNYTLSIKGNGSLEDMEEPKFDIPGVTVYSDDGQGTSHVVNGEIISNWVKKYTFIADRNFIIPSIKKTVLDPKTGKTKEISTESFNINVRGSTGVATVTSNTSTPKKTNIPQSVTNNSAQTQTMSKKKDNNASLLEDTTYYERLRKEENDKKWPLWSLLTAALAGALVGAMLMKWIPKFGKNKHYRPTKGRKYTAKEALDILYPHTNDSPEIEEMVRQLYKAQRDKSVKIDQEKLQKIINGLNS